MFLPVLFCALAPFASAQVFRNGVQIANVGSASQPLIGVGTGTNALNGIPVGIGAGSGSGNIFTDNGAGTSVLTVNPAAVGTGTGSSNNFAGTGTGTGSALNNNFGPNSSNANPFTQSAATRSGTSNIQPFFQVGRCRTGNIYVDPAFNTASLFNEAEGYWIVSLVPQTAENTGLTWAHAHVTRSSASSQQFPYELSFYTQKQGEELRIGLKLILTDDAQSLTTTATAVPGQYAQQSVTFKVYYLGHTTGVWTYLYICSDQFSNTGVDYRYLLTHGNPMTPQDLLTIQSIDDRNQFQGALYTVY